MELTMIHLECTKCSFHISGIGCIEHSCPIYQRLEESRNIFNPLWVKVEPRKDILKYRFD